MTRFSSKWILSHSPWYKFRRSRQQDWGHLTWNLNGTLSALSITDALNANNTQSCNYFYDDLGRLAGQDPNDASHPTINCGTKWKQGITLDAFGNIAKSATVGTTFQATYTSNPPTNRISQIGSLSPTYDANGNLTYDATTSTTHQYTWDAEGKMLTVDNGTSSGVCLTYDALGRIVEQGRGSTCSTYTQIAYAPSGFKLALLSGQSLQKALVPLTGGATAVYNPSGLQYFRHPDWLGSSRLASKPNRTLYYDTAYAPFAEDYVGMIGSGGAVDLNFTGQNEDTASWMYDFMFREYNPVQGRWMSPDPAGLSAATPSDPQTWNRYSYVVNSPLLLSDPAGMCPVIYAGITQSPPPDGSEAKNPSVAALIELATAVGANLVFPYNDEGVAHSIGDVFGQGWGIQTGGTTAGIDALKASNDGSPVVALAYSGGAQTLDRAVAATGIPLFGVDYISPGQGLFGGGPLVAGQAFTHVFRGTGLVDGVVNFTAPASGNMDVNPTGDCGHDLQCALSLLGAVLKTDLKNTSPCSNPRIYTRKGSRALGNGGAGGNGGQAGGNGSVLGFGGSDGMDGLRDLMNWINSDTFEVVDHQVFF